MGAVLDVFNVLLEPKAVFERVREKPRFLEPFLVIAALVLVMAVLTRPYQAAAFEGFRATLAPEQAERMRGGGGQSVAGLVFVPVIVCIGLAAGAGLLWIGVSLTGVAARYRTLLSALTYSYVTYIIFGVLSLAVLMVRGIASVTSFADLRPPLGLDLVMPTDSLFVGGILNGINPVSAWGVWLCGTGIAITHGTSRGGGIVVAALVFLFGLVLQSVPLLFLGMATR